MRDGYDNWITGSGYENFGNYQLYNAGFYFTVTTMVTVGYGDITAKNLGERIFCIFLMFFGVFTFSFGTGIIASIIQNYDQQKSQQKIKLANVDQLYQKYDMIDSNLLRKLVKNVYYGSDVDSNDLSLEQQVISELPFKLKMEVKNAINRSHYEKIGFFT